MSTLYITRGFPASGKTTWALGFCARTGAVNINRDDIRRQLTIGQHGTDRQETDVTGVQTALVRAAVNNGSDIVLSDTNLRPRQFRPLIAVARQAGYTVEVRDFRVDLDELLRRNAAREADRRVPPEVIRSLWNRFPYRQWPTVTDLTGDAGYDPTRYPVLANPRDLPHCVLVDVDGTLAHHDGLRSPYDWAHVGRDTVDPAVRDAVRDIAAAGVRVVIMSGRDASCRRATEAWLVEHGVPHDELHMRPTGDRRADWIIKDTLIREHVEGRYHIRYCLDDRSQVVDHYRALGLKVFQVQPGDF